MIISEKVLKKGLTVDVLREQVKECEHAFEKNGRKVTAIVGTKGSVSDEVLHKLLPEAERAMKKFGMKFAAGSFINPGNGRLITLNVLMAQYLDDDNACQNFLIKQRKYGLTKVNIID